MSEPLDPYFQSAEYIKDVVYAARNLLSEIEEHLAGDGEPLQNLPGYPAEFGMGSILSWHAVLGFLLNWSEEGCTTISGNGPTGEASVGLAWLRNLLRRLSDRWLDDREEPSPFTFVGSLIAFWDESDDVEGMPILTDVSTIEEGSPHKRDEAFERSVRRMIAKWETESSALHIGFVLIPALDEELEMLNRISEQLREEFGDLSPREVCVNAYMFKSRWSIDPAEVEALRRAIGLLDPEPVDGDSPVAQGHRLMLPPGPERLLMTATFGLDGDYPEAGRQGPRHISKSSRIVGVFYEHNDWSNAQIAQEVGADPGYVSRILKPIRERFRAVNASDVPKGRKDRDGAFEAWQA
ncbi:hypothetical protein AB1L88_11630 [Tautonia sp. JC769]|uniref:hypothetical protein n=1 Tax=Tautonia sp. JC769 TaxID=3232135 RepID=UPI00345AD552